MKIFLDTNIFLDTLLNREGQSNATQVLNACANGQFNGYVADITLLNIDYVARKQVKDVKLFLETIVDTFVIVGADNITFTEAFKIDNNDLEDSVQYLCAKQHECEVIVSNDKDFYRGETAVLSCSEFMQLYVI